MIPSVFPFLDHSQEPWTITIPGLPTVLVDEAGAVSCESAVSEESRRFMLMAVGRPFAEWRLGRWIVNAPTLRSPDGAFILVSASLDGWYALLTFALRRGWCVHSDGVTIVESGPNGLVALPGVRGPLMPERRARLDGHTIARSARLGGEAVELAWTPHDPGPIGGLALEGGSLIPGDFHGFARAALLRSLLTLPTRRPARQICSIITALADLPAIQLASPLQPRRMDSAPLEVLEELTHWLTKR
jgi:hypothetical protein